MKLEIVTYAVFGGFWLGMMVFRAAQAHSDMSSSDTAIMSTILAVITISGSLLGMWWASAVSR